MRGGTSLREVGKAAVLRPGKDATIVATLLMVERSLQAAEIMAAEGIEVEVIDLRWLNPVDRGTINESLRKTGRLIIVEEQYHAGGWGATVVSQAAIDGVRLRSRPAAVSLAENVLIPYSPPLEDSIIPSKERIVAAT